MAAATQQKEKDAAERHMLIELLRIETNPSMVIKVGTASEPPPTVVSPPSAPNLNSLLTGHVNQEGETLLATNSTTTAMVTETQAKDTVKSLKKKKSKKVKSTSKEDKSTKPDRSGSVLKKSTFATSTLNASTPAKEYNHKRVFYKAGLELKGEDKYGAYVNLLGNFLENIQLVNPLAIMHAADETGGAKLLESKTKMSTNMTIFLAYALVGINANAFKPKRNNNKKQGHKGKDKPDTLDPSVYLTLVFSSDVNPNIIISCVTHEFCCAGGFYFQKKQLQCVETVTPFIIYYLYTFNDIATLRAGLTSLLEEAHQGMQDDLTLPEEFKHAKIPEINIR